MTHDETLGALLRELDTPEHRPEFHHELRRRLREERTARRRRTTLRWAAPAAAVAAVAAFAVVGLPRTDRGPEPASAAVVKAHVRTALDTLHGLRGVLVASGPRETDRGRWRFAFDARGDLRLEGPRDGDVLAYDAAAGVVRSAQHSASLGGDALFYAERRGVAPGPPDDGPPASVLEQQYGAFVRAALAAAPGSVQETTYDGRPAWRLVVAVAPNAIVPALSGDHLTLVVDRESGLPVRVLETKAGTVLRELRIEQLAVDPALPASAFTLAFPAHAEVMRSDDGFRRIALDDVAATVGYAPLVPSWLPAGYRLAEVAVKRDGAVVSLAYRRGLDRFLVTSRARGTGAPTDPLASPPGYTDPSERVAVPGGTGRLVLSPRTPPHVWWTTGTLVVTVGGDLDRAELLRVARSL